MSTKIATSDPLGQTGDMYRGCRHLEDAIPAISQAVLKRLLTRSIYPHIASKPIRF